MLPGMGILEDWFGDVGDPNEAEYWKNRNFSYKKRKNEKKASKPVYELEGAFGLTKDSDPTRVPEEGKVSVRDVSPRLCFILFLEF